MKAVVIKEFGTADGLEVVDLPVPDPAPGQVRVAVEAIGVAALAPLRTALQELVANGERTGPLVEEFALALAEPPTSRRASRRTRSNAERGSNRGRTRRPGSSEHRRSGWPGCSTGR